jgi:predicted GIY-YIG superfamily endonuclease
LAAHNLGKGAKYTRSRTPVGLLGTSAAMTRSEALKLEHRIKKTPTRRKHIELDKKKAYPKMRDTRMVKEIQKELQSVVKSLGQLTDSVANIVAAVEKLTRTDASERPKAKRAPVRKIVVVKNGVVEKIKRIPATQIVYDLIRESPQGMDTAALMKATGFNQRKVHNTVFQLKKQGQITSTRRGVYRKI